MPIFHDARCAKDGWRVQVYLESFYTRVRAYERMDVCEPSLTRHWMIYCWEKPTANRVHKNTGFQTKSHRHTKSATSDCDHHHPSLLSTPRLLFGELCSRCQGGNQNVLKRQNNTKQKALIQLLSVKLPNLKSLKGCTVLLDSWNKPPHNPR